MHEQPINLPGRRRLGSSQRRVCALCLPEAYAPGTVVETGGRCRQGGEEMNRAQAIAELASIQERIRFLNAFIKKSFERHHKVTELELLKETKDRIA